MVENKSFISDLADRLEKSSDYDWIPCPTCEGARVRGWIHGCRCPDCNGHPDLPNPDYDPSIKHEVVKFLRSLIKL